MYAIAFAACMRRVLRDDGKRSSRNPHVFAPWPRRSSVADFGGFWRVPEKFSPASLVRWRNLAGFGGFQRKFAVAPAASQPIRQAVRIQFSARNSRHPSCSLIPRIPIFNTGSRPQQRLIGPVRSSEPRCNRPQFNAISSAFGIRPAHAIELAQPPSSPETGPACTKESICSKSPRSSLASQGRAMGVRFPIMTF